MSVLEVYCDGSGTHHANSPACLGVAVFLDGEVVCESSQCVGFGTNNVAELWAIRRALYLVQWVGDDGFDTEAIIYSDSAYAIGMTIEDHVARANWELVEAIRERYAQFRGVRFQHVSGHAGIYGNELADWLAGYARHKALVARGDKAASGYRRRPDPVKCGRKALRLLTGEPNT